MDAALSVNNSVVMTPSSSFPLPLLFASLLRIPSRQNPNRLVNDAMVRTLTK